MDVKTSQIPEKIKIGDTEITVKDHPELLALIETVRKQEKTKLHTDITTLEADKKALEAKIKENGTATEAQKAELEGMKTKLATLTAEKAELEKLKNPAAPKTEGSEDMMEKLLGKVTELITKNNQELLGKVTSMVTPIQQQTVDQYLTQVREKYKGQIIPELLTGKTKEEIDQNLPSVIKTSANYITVEYEGKNVTLAEKEAAEAVKKATPPANPPAEGKTPPTPPNNGTPPGTDPKTLIKDVSKMSAEEYAKNRSAILAEAQTIKAVEQTVE